MLKLKKCIVKPKDWNAELTFNPAVYYDGENVYLWPRIIFKEDYDLYISKIGLMISKDGVNFQRVKIVVQPDKPYDKFGCEDPRVTKFEDSLYMTYVALEYGAWTGTSRTALIKIDNPLNEKSYKKLGIITWENVDDKDVVLFPEKIKGKYIFMHRPQIHQNNIRMKDNDIYVKFGEKGWFQFKYKINKIPEKPSIWISFTEDFRIRESNVLYEPQERWENEKVGAGAPPIKISEGWLVIYHGVQRYNNKKVYRAGALLLDKKDPTKIIGKYGPILEPTEPWEKYGEVSFVVFPTGAFIKDNDLYVYYGAADTYIGLAIFDLDKLINKIL